MSLAAEIYRYPQKIQKELRSIQTQLRKEDAEILAKYYTSRVAEGISHARILKCLNTLKTISRISSKPFNELTKDDVVELVARLEQRNVSERARRGFNDRWKQRQTRVTKDHAYKTRDPARHARMDGMKNPEIFGLSTPEASKELILLYILKNCCTGPCSHRLRSETLFLIPSLEVEPQQ